MKSKIILYTIFGKFLEHSGNTRGALYKGFIHGHTTKGASPRHSEISRNRQCNVQNMLVCSKGDENVLVCSKIYIFFVLVAEYSLNRTSQGTIPFKNVNNRKKIPRFPLEK